MAHTAKPKRGERAKTNKGKRVKAKTNPLKPKPKKTAFGYGANEKKTKRTGKG